MFVRIFDFYFGRIKLYAEVFYPVLIRLYFINGKSMNNKKKRKEKRWFYDKNFYEMRIASDIWLLFVSTFREQSRNHIRSLHIFQIFHLPQKLWLEYIPPVGQYTRKCACAVSLKNYFIFSSWWVKKPIDKIRFE